MIIYETVLIKLQIVSLSFVLFLVLHFPMSSFVYIANWFAYFDFEQICA